jgi:perosamine synthetase
MIPVNKPSINRNDYLAVKKAIEATSISGISPAINDLKKSFSSKYQIKYSTTASSGTAALEAALSALGVEAGDEIILPAFTIITCATVILRLKAMPVIVDVEDETYGLDFDKVLKAITKKTKCIMLCHLFGMAAKNTVKLKKICCEKKIFLLEDISQSYGASIAGKLVGQFGDISAGSLYSNKIITAGEGGIILSNNEELISNAEAYCNLCFGKKDRFVHEKIGFNYRMSGLAAALANSQINRLNIILEQRDFIKKAYLTLFSSSKKYEVWKGLYKNESVLWMFPLKLKLNKTINDLETYCLTKNFQIRKMYLGLNKQPCLKNKVKLVGSFKVSDDLYNKHFYIPTYIGIKTIEMEKIYQALENF